MPGGENQEQLPADEFARNNLIESIAQQVLVRVHRDVLPREAGELQPEAEQQGPAVPVIPAGVEPVARGSRALPTLTNRNYQAQIEFAQRLVDLLADPSLYDSPVLDRVRVLLRRRIATVVAADKDSGAFDTLDRFELAESVKGDADEDFYKVLQERSKNASSTKRGSSSRDRSHQHDRSYDKRARYGSHGGLGVAVQGGGGGFALPLPPAPFGGFSPFAPFGAGPGFRPSSSANCYACNQPGHRARHCPNRNNRQ